MMSRNIIALAPLLNRQSTRGMATLKDVAVKLDPVKNLQRIAKSDFARAALVELTPPTPAEIPKALKDGYRIFFKRNWRDVTVREAWRNALVSTEVLCWFFVGECIGKGTLIGYQV